MRPQLLTVTLVFVLLFSCKSQQYTADDLPEMQLVFGKGGGMVGSVDTYALLQNGQLFHTNSITKTPKELKGISTIESKELFLRMDALNLEQMDINHPGNVYYFLEDVGPNRTSRIVWGSTEHEIDTASKELYDHLIALVK